MERQPFIPCDERRRASCKHGPHCERLQATEHHIRPRRLLKFAREAQMENEYQRKLRKVIHHPFNIVLAPRCIHDILDSLTSDTLPEESELDSTLLVWNRDEQH